MHDTHWTDRGALAAFNAIVEADGHPDWRLDAGVRAWRRRRSAKAAISFRMLGVEDGVDGDRRGVEAASGRKTPDRPVRRTRRPTIVLADRRARADDPGARQLVHPGLFSRRCCPSTPDGWSGCTTSHCAFDWKLDRKVSPRRSLVDADRARPLLRTRGEAAQLPPLRMRRSDSMSRPPTSRSGACRTPCRKRAALLEGRPIRHAASLSPLVRRAELSPARDAAGLGDGPARQPRTDLQGGAHGSRRAADARADLARTGSRCPGRSTPI